MKQHRIPSLALAASLLAALSTSMSAAVIQTVLTNGTNRAAFDGNISSTDLINVGQTATYSSVAVSEGTTWGATTAGNDGSATNYNAGGNVIYDNSVAGATITFDYALNTSVNTLGYDITSIQTIYGYGTGPTQFADQKYDVYYTTVGAPSTYILLASVNYDPATAVAASSQITITENAGSMILASGVQNIRFELFKNPNQSNQIGIAHEFDVFGAATVVPEPSAALLGGLGLLALLRRRRD